MRHANPPAHTSARLRVAIMSAVSLLHACTQTPSETQDITATLVASGEASTAANGHAYAARAEPPGGRIDRSQLSDVGTGPLDYANRALWACRPGNDPDECAADLRATEILKDGSYKLVEEPRAVDPPFDCFYLMPTVYFENTSGNQRDLSDITHAQPAIVSQAARFERLCQVYAPLYRQTAGTIDSMGHVVLTGDAELVFGDVVAAFDYYINKLANGRKFVILAHSQGSVAAIELLKRRIDYDPVLHARMISAVLLGGDVRVPAGESVGGTFQNIRACRLPGQTACVIAYSSFAAEAPPTMSSVYGKQTDAGHVLCTEPAALAARSGSRLRGSYFPLTFDDPTLLLFGFGFGFLPTDLTTPFMLYRDYFTGRCVDKGGSSYLEISVERASDDTRQDPPYRSLFGELSGVGLHLADYNLELDDLIDAVRLQADAAP